MKKAIVIYDTRYGNTEKIAKALTAGLQQEGIEAVCIKAEAVDTKQLGEYDFLAIGGPTHRRGLSKSLKGFLKTLDPLAIRGKKAFAFDTKVGMPFAGSAAKKIEKELEKAGTIIVHDYASAIVKGRKGPLETGMEDLFRQIAHTIASNLR